MVFPAWVRIEGDRIEGRARMQDSVPHQDGRPRPGSGESKVNPCAPGFRAFLASNTYKCVARQSDERVFVTGTDTGVGQDGRAACMRAPVAGWHNKDGRAVRAMATGDDDIASTVVALRRYRPSM
jgi:hypothetical protein